QGQVAEEHGSRGLVVDAGDARGLRRRAEVRMAARTPARPRTREQARPLAPSGAGAVARRVVWLAGQPAVGVGGGRGLTVAEAEEVEQLRIGQLRRTDVAQRARDGLDAPGGLALPF